MSGRMRIAIVHGYFLADSGSGIYVRELAKAFTVLGHDVTLVCQEKTPEKYDFIDAAFALDSDNHNVTTIFERTRQYAGSCRCVRPDIHGLLLTYVASGDKSFENHTFQDASPDKIDAYLKDNITALSTIFKLWSPDAVQANHAIMQPYEVREALQAAGLEEVPFTMTIHGSALNFSLKADSRLLTYFVAAARDARAITALSESSVADVVDFAAAAGADISGKTLVIPPGVDTTLFRPLPHVNARKQTVGVFAGRLLWTKGPQYAIAALPLILRDNPDFELWLAGDGPLEPGLRRLIELLSAGDITGAAAYAKEAPEMGEEGAWGPVIPDIKRLDGAAYSAAAKGMDKRVMFLGHLAHDEMAPAFAGADVALMPSVYPEAYGLSAIEAAAAGAVPIATYQTGLRTPLDILAAELGDPALTRLLPDGELTRGLAAAVTRALAVYETQEPGHRQRLHEAAKREFSWESAALAYLAAF